MLHRIRSARQDDGFTLIELLIVIVILGILAGIVVFAIGTTRGDATASSCKTDYKSIELGAEAYYTKTGNYPALATGTTPPAGALLKTFPGGADYGFTYTTASNTILVTGPKSTGSAGIAGCG